MHAAFITMRCLLRSGIHVYGPIYSMANVIYTVLIVKSKQERFPCYVARMLILLLTLCVCYHTLLIVYFVYDLIG